VKRAKLVIFDFLLLTLPTLAWAAAEKSELLEKKVSLQGLNWLNYFFAKWYNENLWVYALIVTVLMGVVGGLIAVVTDVFLKAIGMEVSKIEHRE
jgi:ABC-type phosphate/phosphonate transport system permease subunit